MYDGWNKTGAHSREWVEKTDRFIDNAFSLSGTGVVGCPCSKYQNGQSYERRQLSLDLCKFGFIPGYEVWYTMVSEQIEMFR